VRDYAESFDLVVLGAGAGGLTAATVAALHGLSTLLLEKSGYVGGTTAISGGMVWVPNNHLMREAGISDSLDAARTYLAATVREETARAKLEAYLDAAPRAIRFLCERTEVQLQPVLRYPDYYPELPGATLGGRVLEAVPFAGARLGEAFAWLRPPLPEFTILGGMMVARADIPHFRRCATSWTSAVRVARLIIRHLRERLSHPRGTSLVLGNALVGRLMLSAMNAGVQLRRNVRVKSLVLDNGRCCGVRLAEAAADKVVTSRRGVVLATGGFAHDVELRRRFMPAVASEISATVGVATGDGLRFAEAAGAAILTDMIDPALWVPVSRYTAADGRDVIYPHTVTDRAKPGAIAVDLSGRRFVNEAVSYHEFVRAMLRSPNCAAMRAYLICDSRFIWRFGLGAIAPFTLRLAPYVQAGYLKVAGDLEGLASRSGIDAAALRSTVRSFNEGAACGKDPEFGRGGDDYQRHLGNADQKPNPCVAPILKPPFYAVELRPGDLGTAVGLSTDEMGRVLSSTGIPVPGLYAVGNDAASIMHGHYPGPGITLGPALTHGYLVAKSAAESGAE